MPTHRRILLAVDTSLSQPTQLALHIASELLEQSSHDVHLVLLHVIPVAYDPSRARGVSIGDVPSFSPAPQQRLQSERALWRARKALQQRGIALERIEWMQRNGVPADEIVKVARELAVERVVLGSHGNALAQRIRRVLVGSTTRRVRRLVPCPVTLVVPPQNQRQIALLQ